MTATNTQRAVENSAVLRVVRRAVAGSVVVNRARTATSHTRTIGSTIASAVPETPLTRAVEHSTAAKLARMGEAIARASFCYRWLTTEPDGDVIIIDLRESYIVDPVLLRIDRLVNKFRAIWHSPAFEWARDMYVTLSHTASRSVVIRTLLKLFEPPPPPEDRK